MCLYNVWEILCVRCYDSQTGVYSSIFFFYISKQLYFIIDLFVEGFFFAVLIVHGTLHYASSLILSILKLFNR